MTVAQKHAASHSEHLFHCEPRVTGNTVQFFTVIDVAEAVFFMVIRKNRYVMRRTENSNCKSQRTGAASNIYRSIRITLQHIRKNALHILAVINVNRIKIHISFRAAQRKVADKLFLQTLSRYRTRPNVDNARRSYYRGSQYVQQRLLIVNLNNRIQCKLRPFLLYFYI